MEFRGHEHVLECAIFAPIVSYPYIQELIGDEVCLQCRSNTSGTNADDSFSLCIRTNQKISYQASM